jgi:hypothetical protein
MGTGICRGYQCNSTELIEAHIIARAFAKEVRGQHRHNWLISDQRVSYTQLGIWDSGILCATCDGKLGDLDNYALSVCRGFQNEHAVRRDGLFELRNVDGDKFAKFVLALLWRASISRRPEFAKTALGSYEDRARDVIFDAEPLSALPEYELFVERYRRKGQFNPAGNYTMPARMTVGLTGWYFGLNGFRILAKLAPWPASYAGEVVNCNDKLVGSFVDYETTTEGQSMIAKARLEAARATALAQRIGGGQP